MNDLFAKKTQMNDLFAKEEREERERREEKREREEKGKLRSRARDFSAHTPECRERAKRASGA
jgi:hypothetical protein